MSEQANTTVKRHKKYAAPLGFFVIILTVIGFVTLIVVGTRLFFSLTDDTAQREKYAAMIDPIVMLDPPNFAEPGKLSDAIILQSSIWSTVFSGDITRFSTDENGQILIPVADLDAVCKHLYGPTATVPRRSMTVDGGEVDPEMEEGTVIFEFRTDIDSFVVPILGEFGEYTAKVESIRRSGDEMYLTVGYYPKSSSWYDEFTDKKSTDTAEKFKVYVMKKNPDTKEYYVYALQNADINTVTYN